MIIYRRMPDKGRYVVYELDVVMQWTVFALFVAIIIYGSTAHDANTFRYVLPLFMLFLFIDIFGVISNRWRTVFSTKKMKKEGSIFRSKQPLTWYFER